MSRPLSVLHISTWDNRGGAGRAAYRVHSGLRQQGVRSRMLVGFRASDDPDVARVSGPGVRVLDRVIGRGLERLGLESLFYPSSFLLGFTRWFREADVIHLANLHSGYLGYAALPLVARQRPVVWTLHDMWAMTGHCGYSYECERWRTGCGRCPHLAEPPLLTRDTSAFLWKAKDAIYRRAPCVLVAPSRWLENQARQSPLLSRFPVHRIPYAVDTAVLRPSPRAAPRERLGLDPARRVVAFIAVSSRKGTALIKPISARLHALGVRDVTFAIVGGDADHCEVDPGFQVKRFGYVEDERQMATIYAAADMLLSPTLADNLPLSVIESMACGTPVVAFDVGGCSDAVRHMETGYLARYLDLDDVACGAKLLLEDAALRARLADRCCEIAQREYPLALQATRYRELYESLLRA